MKSVLFYAVLHLTILDSLYSQNVSVTQVNVIALLLAKQNERILNNLALFLYKAFNRKKKRKENCYREELKCTL